MEVKAGYKQTEIGVIPEDWEIVQLADIFTFKNGLNKEKQFFGKGTPIVNYMDVYKNSGIVESDISGRVTLSPQEIKNYEVKKGDVFFTRTSETIEEIGLSTVVLSNVKDTVFSGFVLRARPKNERLTLQYKKYCFSTSQVRKEITSKSSYTTRALTNGRLLSNVKIAIPKSTSEQTAIATALSDADALISSLEKLTAKKRNIKQGAMQKLLQPKEGWEVKRLGDIASIYQPQTISQKDFTKDGFLVYGANGIVGRYHLFNHAKWQTTVTCRGSTCGTVNRTVDKSWITGNAMVMNVDDNNKVDKLFFYYLLSNQDFSKCITGSGQPQIVREPLKEFKVALPKSISKQKEIAEMIMDLDTDLVALETKLEKYKQIKQGMMQQLLTGKIRLAS